MADPSDFDWSAPGQVNRSAIAQELQDKPWLHDRLKQMVRGEVGNSASDEVRRIQLETAMNRALVRGHSLEQGLWDVGQHGNKGYYPPQTFSRGGYDHDTYTGDLNAVLGGSNYGGKYLPPGQLVTGNASGDVAAHQFQKGTPGFTLPTGSGPESYFNEDRKRSDAIAGLLTPSGAPPSTPVSVPAPSNPVMAFLGKLGGGATPPPASGAGLPQAGPTPTGATLDAVQKLVDADKQAETDKQSKGMMALAQQLLAASAAPKVEPMQLAPGNTGPLRPLPLDLPRFGQQS
jgi:hypothetical protein